MEEGVQPRMANADRDHFSVWSRKRIIPNPKPAAPPANCARCVPRFQTNPRKITADSGTDRYADISWR